MDLNKILSELEDAKPTDVGNLLMYYIVRNFDKEDRMSAIYEVIRTFGVDFLSDELEEEDRETLRSLATKIKKRL